MFATLASIALILFIFGIGLAAAIALGSWMSAVFASLIDEKPDMTTTAEILMQQ
jgi:hypothetical protein